MRNKKLIHSSIHAFVQIDLTNSSTKSDKFKVLQSQQHQHHNTISRVSKKYVIYKLTLNDLTTCRTTCIALAGNIRTNAFGWLVNVFHAVVS